MTVKFIGPASMTNIDLVGVIWKLVRFAASLAPSEPIHLYDVPSTRILPSHPIIDWIACAVNSNPTCKSMAYRERTCSSHSRGHELPMVGAPAVLFSQMLRYGERTDKGMLAG